MSAGGILKNEFKVKALLIDLDDTLMFGDKKEVFERLSATVKSLSLEIDQDELCRICEHNSCMIDMISEIIVDKDISRERFEKAKSEFDGKFDDLLFLGEGVRETLDYLKELNIPLAIVSTRTSVAINRLLKKMGVFEYFDVIVGRNECQERKPSPEPIEYALKQLKIVSKEGVYMIGDRQNEDIQSAINAGISSILVNEVLDEKEAQPTWHIKSFKDLKTLKIF